jgi:hypothetical protein
MLLKTEEFSSISIQYISLMIVCTARYKLKKLASKLPRIFDDFKLHIHYGVNLEEVKDQERKEEDSIMVQCD